MDVGIFDVLGPVMIGPSSSHTAGALKLARTASRIAGRPFYRVQFALHGSFAKTASGHGTDRALLAGALGLCETDSGIKDIFTLASARGITWEFCETELPDAHENSCVITFFHDDGTTTVVTGSSIGGGQVLITNLDGIETEISANAPTLLILHRDRKGVLGAIASRIAEYNLNIAVMRSNRERRGDVATTVIETDDAISGELVEDLQQLEHIIGVRRID